MKGLGLTPEDLIEYNNPLVAFDRSVILPAR